MGLEKPRENKISDTEPIYLFQKIIAQAASVNELPLLSTIFEKIGECAGDDDYDYETDIMADNWDGSKIKLLDGTEIELVYCKRCILHGFYDIEREYSYKIDDNLYICAGCLSILKEYKDLCNEYYKSYEDLLFPWRWDENRVIFWLKKAAKREEEYYKRRLMYQSYYNYDYDYDFNDEYFEKETEEEKLRREEERIKEERDKKEREDIWEGKECQELYEKLIDYAGGLHNIRKNQRRQAKDMAISAIQKNKEPDYERFKTKVDEANERALKKRERKKKRKQKQD